MIVLGYCGEENLVGFAERENISNAACYSFAVFVCECDLHLVVQRCIE